jgi:translation initiation factor eIF-2B subunit epsilon
LHPILFPLAGTSILAYTLEFLERGGINEIILVCSRLSAQIEDYLISSRWGEKGYPVKVQVVVTPTIRSTGDALREIDRLGIAKSDFVLVRGGVLSNLPLPSVIEEHRQRREEDKDGMLMTIVTMPTETHTAFSDKR